MERQGSLGPTRGFNGESPGVVTRGVAGGVRGVEADTRLPFRVASPNGSEPPSHSGCNVVRSPGSSHPTERVVAPTSELSQQPGEVAGHLEFSPSPDAVNIPCPGSCLPRTSCAGPGGSRMYTSGCGLHSGSTCLHSGPCEDRPRSILKDSSSILMQKSPCVDKKKAQRWDEMNILATYHPSDKDYGFMKVDEPSTPYRRLQDSDEDLLAGSSVKVTPEVLEERFATMDNFLPKVLQYGDNRSSGAADNFSKTHSCNFDKHRKTHYTEGKFLKSQKNLPLEHDEDSCSAGISSGVRGVTIEPKPRPVERCWAGGLAKRIALGDSSDSSSCRNQFPSASTPIPLEQIDLQRREYYSQGRYLRSDSHPEPEEDIEDEQQHSSTDLTLVIEKPINNRSPVTSSWCQWLEAKRQNCRSPGSSEREHRHSQNPPTQNGCRREPGQRQGGGCIGLGGRGSEWVGSREFKMGKIS
uniref:Protein phosphatase inhibitor 2-like n=1 Tax=Urocitellus parryii TaxID=9999 RepID=A0A8D2HM93_UROPR